MLKPLPVLSVQIKHYVWHRRPSPSPPGKISPRLSAGRGIVKSIKLICLQTSTAIELRPTICAILTLSSISEHYVIVQRNSKIRRCRTAILDDVIIVKGHRFKVSFIFNKKSCNIEFYCSSNKLALHRILSLQFINKKF